jgi:hypothetical protein
MMCLSVLGFFFDGPKVLFQCGLALFSIHKTSILASNDPVQVCIV